MEALAVAGKRCTCSSEKSLIPKPPGRLRVARDQAAQAALQAGAISRQAAARYLGRFFGVEDVEADQALVAADEARQDERERAMERWRQRAGFDDPDARGAHELDEEEDAA